jgi:hypothetical protein
MALARRWRAEDATVDSAGAVTGRGRYPHRQARSVRSASSWLTRRSCHTDRLTACCFPPERSPGSTLGVPVGPSLPSALGALNRSRYRSNTLSKFVGLDPPRFKDVGDLDRLFCAVCAERLRTSLNETKN